MGRSTLRCAVGETALMELRLTGAYMSRSICLTGGGEGMGTDIRDVWASSFVLGNGDVLVLFTSPSGLVLDEVTVPPE